MTTTTAPTFDDTDDPQAMRNRVLTAVADAVLVRHAYHLELRAAAAAAAEFAGPDDAPLDVSPAAALAEVIVETNAYWTLETSHGPYVLADYREIAADMWQHGIAAHHIAEARKAAGLRYG